MADTPDQTRALIVDEETMVFDPDVELELELGPDVEIVFSQLSEREDLLARFAEELEKATGDGMAKRARGEKDFWYRDSSHEAAIFSHLTRWKRGELVDPDSGAHPLVHCAWRCLAIACVESGNAPAGGVVVPIRGGQSDSEGSVA